MMDERWIGIGLKKGEFKNPTSTSKTLFSTSYKTNQRELRQAVQGIL